MILSAQIKLTDKRSVLVPFEGIHRGTRAQSQNHLLKDIRELPLEQHERLGLNPALPYPIKMI